MTNYSAMHHAEAAKRAAEGTDAEAASVGLEHSAKTYAEQAAASAATASPPPLFDYDWYDHELNDLRFLRADTFSWHDGTVYSNAYNHLVDDVNGKTASNSDTIGSYTVYYVLADDGHKIVGPDQETTVANIYAESGVAWYYVLDKTNQRFKLPRENPAREELIQVVRAKGDGKVLGAWDGNTNYGLVTATVSGREILPFTNAVGLNAGAFVSGRGEMDSNKAVGLPTDSTKSGVISDMTESTSVYKGKQYLYFYVGQFSQSATEQTAGLNSELFNGKADIDMGNVPSNIGSTAKSYFAGIGMPSDDWENVSLPASGGYVIAPANGYYCISGTGQTLYLGIEDANVAKTLETWINNSGTFLPIYKGQKCIVGYSAAPSSFRFVYAQGEV